MGDDEGTLASLLQGPATSGSGASAGEGDADESGLRADNTRLRQEVAKLQGLTQQSTPFVKAIQELGKTALGKKVIDKLQKGESVDDLLPAEEKKVIDEAAKAGLTKAEFDAALAERDEKLTASIVEGVRIQQDAKDGVEKLRGWAVKELPGFEKIEGHPVWHGAISAVQHAMREKTLVPSEKEDPWQFLYKQAYNMVVAGDPDIVKGTKKAAPKTPEERLAAIVTQENTPSASSSEIDEANIPEEYKRQLEHIRKLKTGAGPSGVGLSFSNPNKSK
jgi:hypothetical protein